MTTSPPRDRFAAWCGWVVAGLAVLTPIFGWLAPLGLAPLVGLAGLLTLPAARITDEDRSLAVAILVMVVWASGSMIWSPYRPGELEEMTALKLVLMAAFFWTLTSAAGRASAASRTRSLRLFAWGMAVLGAILLVEGLTGAGLYRALRSSIGDPIRPDLAARNVTVGAFVLAVLWAPAAMAGLRAGAPAWLALPMVAGVVGVSLMTGTDAPLLALGLGLFAALAVWRWPRGGPRALAVTAATFFLIAPALIWGLRWSGRYEALEASVSLSWAQRMGYWSHAVDWIADRPLRGWGLDASRMFAPGIQLHPHDSALQLWLELGLIGAVAAAVFWGVLFSRMSRPAPDAAVAASAASAVAYLVFGAVSFGIWQEWWLAVGGLSAALCAALVRQPAPSSPHVSGAAPVQRSTIRPISE